MRGQDFENTDSICSIGMASGITIAEDTFRSSATCALSNLWSAPRLPIGKRDQPNIGSRSVRGIDAYRRRFQRVEGLTRRGDWVSAKGS